MGQRTDLHHFTHFWLSKTLLLLCSRVHASELLQELGHLVHIRLSSSAPSTWHATHTGHATHSWHTAHTLSPLSVVTWSANLKRLDISIIGKKLIRIELQVVLHGLNQGRHLATKWSLQEFLRQARDLCGNPLAEQQLGALIGEVIAVVG